MYPFFPTMMSETKVLLAKAVLAEKECHVPFFMRTLMGELQLLLVTHKFPFSS